MATCEDAQGEYQCSLADKYILTSFDALNDSALAMAVKASSIVVPWAGAAHLLALAALGGAVLIVDLRLLGLGLIGRPPAALQRTVQPIFIAALICAIASGAILALGELRKLYYSPPYWFKIASLASAILFTVLIRNALIEKGGRARVRTYATWIAIGASWFAVFIAMSNNLARTALLLLVAAFAAHAWRQRNQWTYDERLLAAAAAFSITLWLATATAGRWIAFY
ncbi:MAG: hypothetical protein GC152_15350 [Alphaproteobacteria bacterium]|nr:hypothetical protein [Alphaproteobacteria bacterium]